MSTPAVSSTIFFFLTLSCLCVSIKGASSSTPAATPSLVLKTCNSTRYYDFCVAALSSDPQSAAAADVKSLASAVINLAASNATDASAFISGLAAASPDASLRAVLEGCITKYGSANEALHQAREALAAESLDDAFLHASAAAEYPTACRVLFQRQRPPSPYPAELARRERDIERLCTVSSEIISLLG